MKNNPAIIVTGIGGNVGQGVLRILRQRYPEFRLVGVDIGTLTAGHYFCDAFYNVPYSYEPGYNDLFLEICRREEIDLIIPTTDYEVYYLGLMADSLPVLIASPPEVAWTFIDKYETWRCFSAAGIPFADSQLPSGYRGEFPEIIVKPREGRGSRNIHLNPPDLSVFDDSYMFQQLYHGAEITTAFYVKKDRVVHGMISFERNLVAGTTERCQIVRNHDDGLRKIVTSMVDALDIKGPCNIQSIVTGTGEIIPFEINCRYSGTSSIRAQLGFPDVVFGVQEYLLGIQPEPPVEMAGSAIRIYLDLVYPGKEMDAIQPGNSGARIF
jgi:carbamoyl-phosphate synthase large subunit